MFTKLRDWEKNRHEYAKVWKEKTGGKVMGYFCTYVPEEILHAANVLPVRILGSQKHKPTDFSHYLCMPHHVQNPRALPYLTGELTQFKTAVEEWTGRSVSDEDAASDE
jgi:benzoyl-CoA reductase/2-hydroxyglutaryl-CoA dehydratase subunit BcrC/BadD/HgdB